MNIDIKNRLLKLTGEQLKALHQNFTSKKRCAIITGISDKRDDINPTIEKANLVEVIRLAKILKTTPLELIESYNININSSIIEYLKSVTKQKG